MENLVIDVDPHRYIYYIECLIAGLRCLRALAKELLPCSLLDLGPPSGQDLAAPQDPSTRKEGLKIALKIFSEKQLVSQLFHQWMFPMMQFLVYQKSIKILLGTLISVTVILYSWLPLMDRYGPSIFASSYTQP